MPVLTAGPTGVVDLAGRLSAELDAGRAPRASYGSRDVAFAWAAGLPPIVARYVTTAVVDGLDFDAVRITPSGTPAAKVAEGGTKPTATTISSLNVPLSKWAGLALITTEQQLKTEGLVQALAATITSSILLAYDADCIAALTAAGGPDGTGTDWTGAINDGIGQVVANGGTPGLLVISAADYAAAVASPGIGYAMDPTEGVVTLFGLRVVISAAAVAGQGFVLDPASCIAVENSSSPMAVLDPYSQLATNQIRLAVEAFLGFFVSAPGSVCQLSVTP